MIKQQKTSLGNSKKVFDSTSQTCKKDDACFPNQLCNHLLSTSTLGLHLVLDHDRIRPVITRTGRPGTRYHLRKSLGKISS